MIAQWIIRLFQPRPKAHYSRFWDGTHATCSCGYGSAFDWDLEKHFREVREQ